MSGSNATCRACLTETFEDFFEFDMPCFFSHERLTFYEVFNICSHLNIDPQDGLPQRMCGKCVKDLQCAFNFQQMAYKSNQELTILMQTNESEYNDAKDPLENVTDEEDSHEDQSFLSGVINENTIDNNDTESQLGYNCDECDNNDKSSKKFPTYASSSDGDNDNDFLESVETQIFPQGRYVCKLCKKNYFTIIGLEAHEEIHAPRRKKSNYKESLSIKSPTGGQIITPNVNRSEGTLNAADLTHGICSKLLLSKERKGIPRKPKKTFPCHVCGKEMISLSKLRYHMVMHTGEKDFLCTMCPKAYSTIYALKHHMRAHTGERPYECKFCGDRFLRPTTLKSHMRRHTGERPYGCDICGKRFIQHSSMATHIKLNHMDKTINCPYCEKKYARQTDLSTHLLSHSGDKPHACKKCPSRFTRQSNLNKHMNQQHSSGSLGYGDAIDSVVA